MKTTSDICKEANANKENGKVLNDLWQYIKGRKYAYPEPEFNYMVEMLSGFVENIEDKQEAAEILRKIDQV